jgi:hypothetical protein
MFGCHYLENLPISAVQVATSLNNFVERNDRRPSGGLSQLNPLTLSNK